MDPITSPRGGLPAMSNRLAREHDAIPYAFPMALRTHPTYEHGGTKVQTSSGPTNNYLLRHTFRGARDGMDVHFHALGNGRHTTHPQSTLPSIPSSVTRFHSHRPTARENDQENALSGNQGTRNTAREIPQSIINSNEAVLPWAAVPLVVKHSHDHFAGNWHSDRGRQTPTNPKPNYASNNGWHGSMDVGQIPINNNWKPTSPAPVHGVPAHPNNYGPRAGNELHQNQTMYRRPQPAPHVTHLDNLGTNSHSVADHTSPQRGRGGGRVAVLECAGLPDIHSLGRAGVQEQGDLAGVSHHKTRARRPRTGKETGTADEAGEAEPSRGRARGSKLDGQRHSATRLPLIPVIHHCSRGFKMIGQTPYKSATRQTEWHRQPPIEFGRLRLTDAANPKYTGILGNNDTVLDYEGVGGSILCRLNFSGREIGRLKILTANTKNVREPITKKRLASEVAKLVKRHIGTIKAQPGCGGVTFENVVLAKLHHVSRASWQPELWFEDVTFC